MDALVTTQSRFLLAPDGNYYPAENSYSNDRFWSRYLDVFNAVRVSGRVQEVKTIPPDVLPANESAFAKLTARQPSDGELRQQPEAGAHTLLCAKLGL